MTILDDTPAKLDLIIYRNDTQVKTVSVKNKTNRQLEDLTGVTALMQLKTSAENATVLYTFTTTIANNKITITIPQNEWTIINTIMASPTTIITTIKENGRDVLYYNIGVYDLQLIYAGGVVDTLFRGTITVLKDVSQP